MLALVSPRKRILAFAAAGCLAGQRGLVGGQIIALLPEGLFDLIGCIFGLFLCLSFWMFDGLRSVWRALGFLAHLLRRCEDLILSASPAAARFPLRVQAVLQQGLALRDRYHNQEISLHGLWTATGRLEVKLDRVLAHPGRDAANRRFAKHLLHERPYLFTFLYCPGLDATNNISERAIRALIGARKNWGGNRTPRGARAQAVLTSILQTAKQQGKKTFDVLVELLCGPDPHKVLDLVPVSPEAPRGSLHPPPSFAVPDILATPPSACLAAA